MLSPFDDYPIHQSAAPIAHPVSGDPNHYDRYFFNGYDRDGEVFFGVAMGVYPNRQVIDAAFSVVHDGRQRSVHASGRLPLDRSHTTVGPISIEVVEPLRVNRVRVDAAHLGIEAELEYEARSPALEEPRQAIADGTRTVMDSTRLTQGGTWAGAVDVDGTRIELGADRTFGTKDRSWGVRPVGEPTPGAPAAGLGGGGGIFFLWAPLHLPDECRFLALFERSDGERWYEHAVRTPLLEPGGAVYGESARVEPVHGIEYEIEWRPGTRRARAARITYRDAAGAADVVELEPLLDFQMRGIGYLHEQWAHGRWHGELAEGSDGWRLDELDPLDPGNIHVEQMCRVRLGDREGVGVLEQLVFGPHAPTGLRDFLDGGAG